MSAGALRPSSTGAPLRLLSAMMPRRHRSIRRKINAHGNVSERHERCEMGKNNPQRKAGWVCDPKAVSDHNQFPAIDQSDRWSERPTIKQERSDKHCAGAEQFGSKRTDLAPRNHFVRNRRRECKTENRAARQNF